VSDAGPRVVDVPERSEFLLVDDDGSTIGTMTYRIEGDVAVLPHTVIDRDRRGEGLGDVLVAGGLAELTRRGLAVVPTCWFVAEHLDRHPGAARVVGRP
jgi:predicted GNAT family acetyltransferase